MIEQNKSSALTGKPGFGDNLPAKNNKRPVKWKRVLAALADGQRLNRFEAEWILNDHCLHSTVSTIQKKGIQVERKEEVVPGYQGIPTHVCRYWLNPEEQVKAAAMLGRRTDGPRS